MRRKTFGGLGVIGLAAIAACGSCGRHRSESVAPITAPPSDGLAASASMGWWRDARFGMFIHWGLYSIPAGEWPGKGGNHAEWIRDSAQIPVGEYEKLREQFNPIKFDANQWVGAAKGAGMRYVCITTKHHDGFCLFDTKQTDWSVTHTPFKRDIMREVAEACRTQGVTPCWYHSIMDWHHPDYLPRRPWESGGTALQSRSSEGADFNRFNRYLKDEVTELLTNYGPIGVMWFDGQWEGTWTHDRGDDLYRLCKTLQPSVIVNNRVDKGGGSLGMTRTEGDVRYRGDFGTPEQEIPPTGFPGVDWETCMTMNDHWGHNKNDHNFKTSSDLVRKLADIAGKGGNFLLNVGPTAAGEIPPESLDRLREIGRWMEINGESIHGTQAGPFETLSWGRCTQKPYNAGIAAGRAGNARTATRPWLANFIRAYRPDLDYSAAAVPVVAEALDPERPAGLLEADVIMIPRGCRHPDQAYRFLRFMQTRDVQEELATAHWGSWSGTRIARSACSTPSHAARMRRSCRARPRGSSTRT